MKEIKLIISDLIGAGTDPTEWQPPRRYHADMAAKAEARKTVEEAEEVRRERIKEIAFHIQRLEWAKTKLEHDLTKLKPSRDAVIKAQIMGRIKATIKELKRLNKEKTQLLSHKK